jgi:hypothetical protein
MVDVASDVLLNGIIHPNVFANLAEDLVPRATNVFMEISFERREILIKILKIGMSSFHRLFGGHILKFFYWTSLPVPASAPAGTFHNHLAHIATHDLFP